MQHLSLNETHSGIIGLNPPVTLLEKNERGKGFSFRKKEASLSWLVISPQRRSRVNVMGSNASFRVGFPRICTS